MIVRDAHITRIADNIYNLSILGLKALVALKNAWPDKTSHFVIGVQVNLRNPCLNVAESDGIPLIYQVADEKTSPSIARPRVGDNEDIIIEHCNIATGELFPG